MRKVSIVTDGSCDLPRDMVEKYNIHVAPFQVIFGTEAYQMYGDWGTITKDEFYEKLKTSKEFPTTAVPSPQSIMAAFEAANKEAEAVIGIFISKKLSGTYQSVLRVVPMLEEADITVVDSTVAASTLGALVIEAAKMAQNNATKEAILARLDELVPQAKLVAVLDNIEATYRSGRVGWAKKFMVSALQIKPILHFEDGLIVPGGTLRKSEEVIKRMKFIAPLIMKHSVTETLFVWHSRYLEVAKELLEVMEEHNIQGKEIRLQEAGPVVGTHVGEKSIAYMYIGHYEKKWLLKMKE